MKVITLFSPSKHLWYCTIPTHVTIWMTKRMWEEVKDGNTGILLSADISSGSSNPGLLSLSRLSILCQAQMIDGSYLYRWRIFFFVCFFLTFFGRAVLSEVVVFHLCILVWLYMFTYMCTYAHRAQRSVSCVFPNYPLIYLWRQGPLLNL